MGHTVRADQLRLLKYGLLLVARVAVFAKDDTKPEAGSATAQTLQLQSARRFRSDYSRDRFMSNKVSFNDYLTKILKVVSLSYEHTNDTQSPRTKYRGEP